MSETVVNLALSEIVPGNNDRTVFEPQALADLAENIRQHGLIQPITVRRLEGTDLFQIVAGERRYRACSMLGWEAIPAIVRDLSDEEASAVMLQENTARADLDPIDEGRAYQRRMATYGWTVQQVAEAAGVSVVRVQFRLKLLQLRPELVDLVRHGSLALGYAQILADAGLDTNRQMLAVAKLRDNPRPTPGWFRAIVSELFQQQAQGQLFDLPLLGGPLESPAQQQPLAEPPHPATTQPPRQGHTHREVLAGQVAFWAEAAAEWDRLGKPFKRQECEAAAKAVQLALAAL